MYQTHLELEVMHINNKSTNNHSVCRTM